jgi:hypothetical protein
MTSETQIAKFAISRIGISQNIASIDEGSTQADMCLLWYEHCRDSVLRDFPWGLATKIAALEAIDATLYFGQTAVYAYPEDCLFAKAITNAAAYNGMQYGVGGLRWFWDESHQWDYLSAYSTPFQLLQSLDGNGVVIATAWTNAYLVYVAKSPIAALYPPDLTDAIAWRLAMEIGPPLSSKKTAQELRAQYELSISRAWANAMNEGGPRMVAESPSITCRG